jgi:Holliday junction resolvase
MRQFDPSKTLARLSKEMTLTTSTVSKGQYAEYAVWKKLESDGFSHIIRSYASHGPIDLLCSNGTGEIWAVQVKSAKHGSYLSTKELDRLVDWSRKFNAKPVFAFKRKGRWIIKPLESEESLKATSQDLAKDHNDEKDNSQAMLLEEIIEERLNEI